MSTSRPTSIPLPVQSIVSRKATSTAVNSGVNRRVSTGAMFSMTLCLASTSQALMRTAPATPHGSTHDPTSLPHFEVDGLEDELGEAHEDAAAESDQGVVDEPLTGEADEVHTPVMVSPPTADVGVAHRQPQRDRQVKGRQDLGVPSGLEGQHIDDHRGRDERQSQPQAVDPTESCVSMRSSPPAAAA